MTYQTLPKKIFNFLYSFLRDNVQFNGWINIKKYYRLNVLSVRSFLETKNVVLVITETCLKSAQILHALKLNFETVIIYIEKHIKPIIIK